MKKLIILITCMLSIAINASSQTPNNWVKYLGWTRTVIEADDLRGIEAYTQWEYNTSTSGLTIEFKSSSDIIRFSTSKPLGFLAYCNRHSSKSGYIDNVLVGYYDMNDKLIRKAKILLEFSTKSNEGKIAYTTKECNSEAKALIEYLKTKMGYARILLLKDDREDPSYRDPADIDIKISCMNF